MQYEVKIKKKALRDLQKLPANVKKLLFLLVEDLKADGPIQKGWHNFSPLSKETPLPFELSLCGMLDP